MKKSILKIFTFMILMAGLAFWTTSCETDSTTGAGDENTIDVERLGDTTRGMERATPEGGQSEGSIPKSDDGNE